ncbi:MAG: 4Fe-4S dicluster domain-containing protein [Elusimicrobia bacterium]|nr:4Fe-4S dicluster domain-containing protein [Elusimicrobiota bacterium]
MPEEISRRHLLGRTGAAAGLLMLGARRGAAEAPAPGAPDAPAPTASGGETPSVLVDLTRCIGCRACVRACQSANRLPETEAGALRTAGAGASQTAGTDAPASWPRQELAFDLWTAVNLNKKKDGNGRERSRFVKQQCMHCLEPACVSVCPVAALYKTEAGPVIYRAERCIGCRYCMVACPFDVPRFEWNSGLTPVIGKCQFCAQNRLFRGQGPACAEACPTGALKFGGRNNLLFEAHARINARPETYLPHIYGEHEVGGTSWLYISDIPFEELGFKRDLPKMPLPALTWDVIDKIPAIVAVLASLFAAVSLGLKRGEKSV